MKRHVAATLLALTTLGLLDVHLDVEHVDDRPLLLWQGKQHDVLGALRQQVHAWTRDCKAVHRLQASSPLGQETVQRIARHSPPDSSQLTLVSLLQQEQWLVAEFNFERLSPAVVVLQIDQVSHTLSERAIWSGSTQPFRSEPYIRDFLREKVPQAPRALLDCLQPASFAGL